MRFLARFISLPVVLFAAACSAPATPASAPNDSAVVARVTAGLRPDVVVKNAAPVGYSLADRMAHFKVPGVSIAVVDSGRIVWAHGYGLKEVGTTDSVTPTTIFQAASISKPVTATAMLHLVDEGKLALDTPVNDYLKSWKLPDNRFTAKEKVTLRRLASHSAGLTVHGFPGYAVTDSIPTVQQVLDGAKPANTDAVRVDTTPGSIFRYSGGGTTIEQLVMTDVTGEPFPALMKRLVLDPIGMTNSGYDQPLPNEERGREAVGYRNDGTMIVGRWHIYPEMAPAGLWTTPTDLLKWAMEVTAAKAGKSQKVLSQKAATDMLTMQKEPVGIGPMLHNSGRSFYFEHGGANEGYRAQVMYFPELGQGAAVMTNSDAGSALAQEILYSIAAEYKWPGYAPREVETVAVDSAALKAFAGTYVTTNGLNANVQVTHEGGKLFIEDSKYISHSQLLMLGGDSVVAAENGMEGKFGRNARGVVDRLELAGLVLKRTK
ncbi:MAG: serine hydrolase domain-containing protein [Gemmatimonadaceae bacterium]